MLECVATPRYARTHANTRTRTHARKHVRVHTHTDALWILMVGLGQLEALLADKTQQLTASEEAAQQREKKMGEIKLELDTLKQQLEGREGGLKNTISQLELERDGLKERLTLAGDDCVEQGRGEGSDGRRKGGREEGER